MTNLISGPSTSSVPEVELAAPKSDLEAVAVAPPPNTRPELLSVLLPEHRKMLGTESREGERKTKREYMLICIIKREREETNLPTSKKALREQCGNTERTLER